MNLYELRDAIAAVTEDQLLPFGACSYNDPENPGKSCIFGALMTADERAAIAPDYNKKGVRWLKLNGELPDRFIPIFEVLDRLQYRFDPVSYTHLTLPTKPMMCRSRWSPYH